MLKKYFLSPIFLIVFTVFLSSMTLAKENSHGDSMSGQTFQPIEQPLPVKAVITLGGIMLIGLELWWFLGSQVKPK